MEVEPKAIIGSTKNPGDRPESHNYWGSISRSFSPRLAECHPSSWPPQYPTWVGSAHLEPLHWAAQPSSKQSVRSAASQANPLLSTYGFPPPIARPHIFLRACSKREFTRCGDTTPNAMGRPERRSLPLYGSGTIDGPADRGSGRFLLDELALTVELIAFQDRCTPRPCACD